MPSAGAINTPQILLLSGLGPTTNLTALGIPTVVDLPFVGSNLQDHVLLINSWEVNANFTWDDINRNSTLFNETLQLWETERQGTFAAATSLQFGWLRLPENDTIFETVQDPSAGPTSGHYEFIFIVSVATNTLDLDGTGFDTFCFCDVFRTILLRVLRLLLDISCPSQRTSCRPAPVSNITCHCALTPSPMVLLHPRWYRVHQLDEPLRLPRH